MVSLIAVSRRLMIDDLDQKNNLFCHSKVDTDETVCLPVRYQYY